MRMAGGAAPSSPAEYARAAAAAVRLGELVPGHRGRVFCASPAPGGAPAFATACEDCALRVWAPCAAAGGAWRVAAAKPKAHAEEVLRCSFRALADPGALLDASEAPVVASGGADGTVRLWSIGPPAPTAPEGAPLRLEQRAVHELSEQCYVADFDTEVDDSGALYCASDDVLVCMDAESGARRYEFRCASASAASEAYGGDRNTEGAALIFGSSLSPQGASQRLLALALSDGSVRLHARKGGAAVGAVACGGGAHVTACALGGAAGELLAVGCGDGTAEVFDVRYLDAPLSSLRAHHRPVYALAWLSPQGTAGDVLLTASSDASVKFWGVGEPGDGNDASQPLDVVTREAYPFMAACVVGNGGAKGNGDGSLVLAGGSEAPLGMMPIYVSPLGC